MTRTSACLLLLGAIALAAGVGMIYVPAGVIAGGVLAIAGGVLSLERRDEKAPRR